MNAIQPPRIESLYNVVTRRLRSARTIFEDRVKLDLRQLPEEHWSYLAKPYLLVNPMQTRPAREFTDESMINPRIIQFVAQFDGRASEAEYLAAIDIETAEKQLLWVLANWQPQGLRFGFRPTTYLGMRIAGTREPDVKVTYSFSFNEYFLPPDPPPEFEDEADDSVEIAEVVLHVNDPCWQQLIEMPPRDFSVRVSGGGGPTPPDAPCEPVCPPMLDEGGQ